MQSTADNVLYRWGSAEPLIHESTFAHRMLAHLVRGLPLASRRDALATEHPDLL